MYNKPTCTLAHFLSMELFELWHIYGPNFLDFSPVFPQISPKIHDSASGFPSYWKNSQIPHVRTAESCVNGLGEHRGKIDPIAWPKYS